LHQAGHEEQFDSDDVDGLGLRPGELTLYRGMAAADAAPPARPSEA
jgi:hypothetical protein